MQKKKNVGAAPCGRPLQGNHTGLPLQKPPEETPAARSTTVKMYRGEEDAKGGPINAEVHPSEVENWKAAGWKTK